MTTEPRPRTTLSIAGNVTIRFRGGDYRWIDVKLFEFSGAPSDADLLAVLIAHPQFRDGYIGGPPGNDPAAVHGPYHADAVTAERYRRLETGEAATLLEDFCSLDGVAIPGNVAGDVRSLVQRRLDAAASVYRLSLTEADHHEAGWVLTEFRELVLVTRETRELALVVMGID